MNSNLLKESLISQLLYFYKHLFFSYNNFNTVIKYIIFLKKKYKKEFYKLFFL